MKIDDLVQKLEGIQRIETVAKILNVKKSTAIKIMSILRKNKYVKTIQTSKKKRIYYISRKYPVGGKSYYEIINSISPMKLADPEPYKILGREPSLEETLVFAIKTNSVRAILASLALFKRINNWNELLAIAKKNKAERKVGALYDLARKVIRTRKMSKGFRNKALPSKKAKYIYIISPYKSKDFKEIEKTWRVYLPFNKVDLEDYIYDKY